MVISIESMCEKALKIYHDFYGDSFISQIRETGSLYAVFGDPSCRCFGRPLFVFEKETGRMRKLDYLGGELILLDNSISIPVPKRFRKNDAT